MIPGVVVAAVNRLRPKRISLRRRAWLFATLAIWAALLRVPLYGACSLLLAVGLGRLIGDAVAARGLHLRRLRYVLAALLGLLGVLAALSSGWQAVRESRAVAGLPRRALGRPERRVDRLGYRPRLQPRASTAISATPPPTWRGGHARASSTTAPWRRPRGRTPRIAASSPASGRSGSIPSGSSQLDTPHPTLAEYLASRGYQTAGFVANTNCCTYETGLDRGFAHFEDYSLDDRGRSSVARFPGSGSSRTS